jgi:hypothetical protein
MVFLIICILLYLSGNKEHFRSLDMKEPTDPFKDAECKKNTHELEEYEKTLDELWQIQLKIGSTQQNPLLEKDLTELKRLKVIDQQMTQSSAFKLITDFMTDLKTKIANLKKTNETKKPNYSGNLQNTKGKLCLSDKQIWFLKTRGGNASTGEAQIG